MRIYSIFRHAVACLCGWLACALPPGASAQVAERVYRTDHRIDTARARELRVELDNISFFKDNEYAGKFTKGYTLPGLWLQPKLVYYPSRNIQLEAGFHALKSEFVNAPLIEELPVALECELLSYDHESCYMTARIVNVSASEEVLGDDGRIDPSKAGFVAFDPVNSAYLALGAKVGTAFSDGKALK